MKLHKIIFTHLLLITTLQICFGQEKPKAELITGFNGRISNDSLLTMADLFQTVLSESDSIGYIILYDVEDNPFYKYLYRRRIKSCFDRRGYTNENNVFLFGKNKNELQIEFWKVPKHSEILKLNTISQDYKISDFKKPHLIYDDNWEEDYCPLNFDLKFYSEFLKANPNLIGKIIISEQNFKNYQKQRFKYFRELTEIYKVLPQQIKFVRGKYYRSPNNQFWYVPKK